MDDLKKTGGEEYAALCALAFRQTIAAHKLTADLDGTPLFFSKENFSNGSIETVDVTYPSSPFFLLFNPRLLKGQLQPILDYAESGRWKFPFAPHDLGRYPLANGQKYGGGRSTEENQMPVEESGNMLLMVAAVAEAEGNAEFARALLAAADEMGRLPEGKGFDPENQLCTDDFAGHLAHNTNLSIKAIEALGAYGKLASSWEERRGRDYTEARRRRCAEQWATMADDGDHYRLAFDKPGTWSQKYNLVWDNLLGLHLFPPRSRRRRSRSTREAEPYRPAARQSCRLHEARLGSLDGVPGKITCDFEALVAPLYRFANESPSRVPLTDWYDTKTLNRRLPGAFCCGRNFHPRPQRCCHVE